MHTSNVYNLHHVALAWLYITSDTEQLIWWESYSFSQTKYSNDQICEALSSLAHVVLIPLMEPLENSEISI